MERLDKVLNVHIVVSTQTSAALLMPPGISSSLASHLIRRFRRTTPRKAWMGMQSGRNSALETKRLSATSRTSSECYRGQRPPARTLICHQPSSLLYSRMIRRSWGEAGGDSGATASRQASGRESFWKSKLALRKQLQMRDRCRSSVAAFQVLQTFDTTGSSSPSTTVGGPAHQAPTSSAVSQGVCPPLLPRDSTRHPSQPRAQLTEPRVDGSPPTQQRNGIHPCRVLQDSTAERPPRQNAAAPCHHV